MSQQSARTAQTPAFNPARQLFAALGAYRTLWLLPLVIGTIGATGYALFWPKQYEARQTLVIRDDLIGDSYKPGRFESLESLKSAQETVLEIARRPKVIRQTLKRLGPPGGGAKPDWPDDGTIESTQGRVLIQAPNGEEFGKTEAIVLSVRAGSRERADRFIRLLLDEIEKELDAFRRARFKSMASELAQTEDLARQAYEQAADRLKQMEQQVGADLADLRGLNDAQAGSNGLRQTLAEVKAELRAARRQVETARHQRQVLLEAYSDPEYNATPSELLELQPGLAALKQGLNQARLELSSSLGRFEESHPTVASNREAIEHLKRQIHEHLKAALEGIDAQLDERVEHQQRLEKLVQQYTDRLSRLAAMRVEYEKRVQDYDNKLAMHRQAQENLAKVQALADPSTRISLLTRVDEPQVGIHPLGPSKKTIVLGGIAGGLLFGIGLVLLFAPLEIEELPVETTHPIDLPPETDAQQIPLAQPLDSESPDSRPPDIQQLDSERLDSESPDLIQPDSGPLDAATPEICPIASVDSLDSPLAEDEPIVSIADLEPIQWDRESLVSPAPEQVEASVSEPLDAKSGALALLGEFAPIPTEHLTPVDSAPREAADPTISHILERSFEQGWQDSEVPPEDAAVNCDLPTPDREPTPPADQEEATVEPASSWNPTDSTTGLASVKHYPAIDPNPALAHSDTMEPSGSMESDETIESDETMKSVGRPEVLEPVESKDQSESVAATEAESVAVDPPRLESTALDVDEPATTGTARAFPIQLEKLKHQLEEIRQQEDSVDFAPNSDTQDPEQREASIDEQIARLSDSLARFCTELTDQQSDAPNPDQDAPDQ